MKVSKSDAVKLLVACGLKNAGTFANEKLAEKLNGLDEKKVGAIKDKEVKNLGKAILAAVDEEKDIVIAADAPAKKGTAPAKGKKAAAAAEEDEGDEDEESEESEDEEGEEEEDEESEEEETDEEESEDEESEESEDEDEESDEEESEDEEEEKPAKKTKKGEKGEKPAKKKSTVEKDYFGNRKHTRTSRINLAISDKPKTAAKIAEDAKAMAIHSHLSKLKEAGLIEKTADGFKLSKKGSALRAKAKGK